MEKRDIILNLRWFTLILLSFLGLYLVEFTSIYYQQFVLYNLTITASVFYNFYSIKTEKVDLLRELLIDVLIINVLIFVTGGFRNDYKLIIFIPVIISLLLLNVKNISKVLVASITFFVIQKFSIFQFTPQIHYLEPLYIFAIYIFMVIFLFKIQQDNYELELSMHRSQMKSENELALIGAMTGVLCHKIGTPLNTMRLKIDRIANGKFKENELNALISAQSTIEMLMQNMRETAITEATNFKSKRTNLKELFERLQQEREEISIIIPTENVFVSLSSNVFSKILDDLVDNSLDAGAQSLEIRAKETNERIIISLLDDGEGFSQEALDHVGEAFVSTKNGQGLGIGLYNLKTYMNYLRGEMIISNSKIGACITLHFEKII